MMGFQNNPKGFQGAMQYPMDNAIVQQGPVKMEYKTRETKKQGITKEKPKEEGEVSVRPFKINSFWEGKQMDSNKGLLDLFW